MQGMFNSLINFQGSGTMQPKSKTKGHAPKDIHGGQKFVVKVQLPMTQLAAGALIYDEQRSFQQQVRLWVLNAESARDPVTLPHAWRGWVSLAAGRTAESGSRGGVVQAMSVPESVVAVVRAQHQWRGMKAYIAARREGENLRLYLDQVQERAAW